MCREDVAAVMDFCYPENKEHYRPVAEIVSALVLAMMENDIPADTIKKIVSSCSEYWDSTLPGN